MSNDDRANGAPHETAPDEYPESLRGLRVNADEGREPELMKARKGRRMVSLAALVEHVVDHFNDEHAGESQALIDADTETKKLSLLLGTVDYVLAVESIQLSDDEKADLMRRAYAELFTYGPLDTLLLDETVTTITIQGADRAAVRHGHTDLEPLGALFDDEPHLKKIIRRMLLDARADLYEDEPIIEAGLRFHGRPVSISVALPPITFHITADVRVHPAKPLQLSDLVEAEFITEQAAQLLTAIAQSDHGFAIVGDTESGKTTLLSVLARLLPEDAATVAIERAGELHLPAHIERRVAQWPKEDRPGITFGEQIGAALEAEPDIMLLDEVRADEPQTITPILSQEVAPRQIWVFRGPTDSKRLISALGMVARRGDPSRSEALVHAMYDRVPFVIVVRRRQGMLQLRAIAEWQFPEGADYPDFIELMEPGWEGLQCTGRRPARDLPLAADFWETSG